MSKAIKIIALMLFGFLPVAAHSQEHAPSVEVCRADVAVWYSIEIDNAYGNAQAALITDDIPNRTAIAKLPLDEVRERVKEMIKCAAVTDDEKYVAAQRFYSGVLMDRYFRFVWRHHLDGQLRREDARGLR